MYTDSTMNLTTVIAYDDRMIAALRLYQNYPLLAILPHTADGVREVVRVTSQNRIVGWDSRANYHKYVLQPCFRYGITTPYYKDRFGPRYRYSDEMQLDLRDFMSEYGANPCTLDEAWTLLGGTPGDGSAVCDVLRMTCLTLRADLVMGKITKEQHNGWQRALCSAVEASLDKVKMADRDRDALSVPFAYGHDTHYRAFLRSAVNAEVDVA